MDKTKAQKPKIQQLKSAGFQDPQTAAETSGSYYYSTERMLQGWEEEEGGGGGGGTF